MSSSESKDNKLRLLFDENVKKELLLYLKQEKYDVALAPKGFVNGRLAEISILERRILVSNDRHFTNSSVFPKEKVFSVIWLRTPQDRPDLLIKSFSMLLKENPPENFEGNLIILYEETFEVLPLS